MENILKEKEIILYGFFDKIDKLVATFAYDFSQILSNTINQDNYLVHKDFRDKNIITKLSKYLGEKLKKYINCTISKENFFYNLFNNIELLKGIKEKDNIYFQVKSHKDNPASYISSMKNGFFIDSLSENWYNMKKKISNKNKFSEITQEEIEELKIDFIDKKFEKSSLNNLKIGFIKKILEKKYLIRYTPNLNNEFEFKIFK